MGIDLSGGDVSVPRGALNDQEVRDVGLGRAIEAGEHLLRSLGLVYLLFLLIPIG